MSFNGSGTYSLPAGNPVTTGTTISSTWANNTLSDIATGLTNALCKDGQSTPTANIKMGGFKITNVAAGTAATDNASVTNVQNSTGQQLTTIAGTNTITAQGSPTITAYANGQTFRFTPAGTNTGATTLNIDSLGAKNVYYNGAALTGGEIPAAGVVTVTYDGTQFNLTAPANASGNPFSDASALVKNSSDATKKAIFSAASITTATTRTYTLPDKNGTVAMTSDIPSSTQIPIRQTVLSGTVDSSGLPNFGGSTGSTTVTTSTTLTVTFANGYGSTGAADYVAQSTNPSWTGLSTNGTMYLYLDYNSGTPTTGSTTLAPTYQWGGTYSTTNNQNTYNIQEATMKVGNGSSASVVNRVFVGEVTVAANVVSAITWYALMGRYDSGFTATLPSSGTTTSKNHNLGVYPGIYYMEAECTTNDGGYVVGQRANDFYNSNASANGNIGMVTTTKTASVTAGNGANPWAVSNGSGGAQAALTLANWKWHFVAYRGW